jgi:hypothetical protein
VLQKTITELRAEIEAAYDEAWTKVYSGSVHRKARLIVTGDEADSAYRESTDEIFLHVPGWGVDEPDSAHPQTWPRWRGELVHEMAHEYVKKMRPTVTPGGTSLYKSFPRFDGEGHLEEFWTAVEAISTALGLDPYQVGDVL